jgi:hypothetical protein
VTQAHCLQCGTTFTGAFDRGALEGLDAGQVEFLRLFVVSRGNLRAVGRKLGISYPSVRRKLEELSAALSKMAPTVEADDSRP